MAQTGRTHLPAGTVLFADYSVVWAEDNALTDRGSLNPIRRWGQ